MKDCLLQNPNDTRKLLKRRRSIKKIIENNKMCYFYREMIFRETEMTTLQKAITDSRKESMEGVSVPNAAEVLPIYFSHEQVQAVETEILECAKMHIECVQVQTRL